MPRLEPTRPIPDRAAPPRGTLGRLLAGLAAADGSARFCEDLPGLEISTGRPPARWTRAAALDEVDRLADRLRRLRLDPGAAVAIHLGNVTEACLALLAVETAGLTPCLAPASFDGPELDAFAEAAGVRAIVTQTRLGDLRPAETVCAMAARRFRIRFVLAFGPDVPAGVIDLDHATAATPDPSEAHLVPGGQVITWDSRPSGRRTVIWPTRNLLAAAVAPIQAMRIGPGDVILALVAQDDLKGFATGLVACLLTGATLRLGDGPTALRVLDGTSDATHVVLPAWAAPAFLASLTEEPRALVLVQDATSPSAAPAIIGPTLGSTALVGILSLGETALLADRAGPGEPPPTPAQLVRSSAAAPSDFLGVRIGADDEIELRGFAVAPAHPETVDAPTSSGWRRSGFRLTDTGLVRPSS